MEALLKEFINGGGPLVAFVVVVYFMSRDHHKSSQSSQLAFLQHMASQAELNRQMHREMHGDNLMARKESQVTLAELSTSVKQNTEATVRLCMVVDRKALA